MPTRRRGAGDGSIYRRSDGLWIGSVNVGRDGGARKRKTVSAKTRAEVVSKLRSLQSRLEEGLPAGDGRVTIAQLAERWLTDVLPARVSEGTFVSYEYLVRVHVLPGLGTRVVRSVTPIELSRFLGAKAIEPARTSAGEIILRADGQAKLLSPRTIQMIRGVLIQLFSLAERWELIGRNPAKLTDPPRSERQRGRTLSPEQARQFVVQLRGSRLEAALLLTLALGLRRGETLGLAWSDLNLVDKTVEVRTNLKRARHGTVLGELKTEHSRRRLNLPIVVCEALERWRGIQDEDRARLGEAWTDSGLVFTSPLGTAIDPDGFSKAFKVVASEAGLGDWHIHELRHSAASLLLGAGVPLKVVSEYLGHSNVSTTGDLYAHVLPAQFAEVARTVDDTLFG